MTANALSLATSSGRHSRTRRLCLQAALAGLVSEVTLGAASSFAQQRPTRVLVGFTPGGVLDALARALSASMSDSGTPAIVENRPGASERIAIAALLAAPPDGGTLLATGGSPLAVLPHVYRKLSYDPHDLRPVAPLCSFPFALTVGPAVPPEVRTLRQFADWCRANPSLASYGTPGAGTPMHLVGTMLAREGDFPFSHVPYQGAASVTDLLGGRLAAVILPPGGTVQHVRKGPARFLAVSSPQRSPLLPEVPTMAESGFTSVQVQDWFGIFAARGTPAPLVDQLHDTVRRAADSETMRTALAQLTLEPYAASSAEFARRVQADHSRWGPVVQAAGLRIDE